MQRFLRTLVGVALAMSPLPAVGASGAAPHGPAHQPKECLDFSPHKARFVPVAPGVRLEVLEWGGEKSRKPTMVLLTGLGDNAHVYDDFALQFADYFRVIGITRRGFGTSSKPETGYDVATRVSDDVAVLKALDIGRAVFVGHSLAGDELSALGARHPELVTKLVYLDSYDYFANFRLPSLPGIPFTDADARSLGFFEAADARLTGTRRPIADVCDSVLFGHLGEIVGSTTPDYVLSGIKAGVTQPADYQRIQAPRLGIFATFFIGLRQPWYPYLDPADQASFDAVWPQYVAWQQDALRRFGTPGPNGVGPIVFTLPLPESATIEPTAAAYHYVYINNEAFVVGQMRQFLGIPLSDQGDSECLESPLK